jgi:hypothetical protein
MADALIQRLVDTGAPIGHMDGATILHRMMNATFNARSKSVERWRKLELVGEPHPSVPHLKLAANTMLTSLEAHTAKRIQEGDWDPSTTPAELLDDIRTGIACASAIFVGRQRLDNVLKAATVTSAIGHRVCKVKCSTQHPLFVVYDADDGELVTGYLIRDVRRLDQAARGSIFENWQKARRL